MNCSRCGSQLAPNTAFCGACGAPVPAAAGAPDRLSRPALITVLAVLQIVGAAGWLACALLMMAAGGIGAGQISGEAEIVRVEVLFGVLGAMQLLCGIGLLKLQPYGRTLQLVFAWIGLIAIPFGTIISILILVYLYKPGVKTLFSGKPVSDLSADELAQVAVVTNASPAVAVLVVVLVLLLVVFVVGIAAALAVPGLLKARMAGDEASVIGALRAISSAEELYAAACANGGYAVTLDDLAKAAAGTTEGFISPDLGTNGVTKSGYRVTLARNAAADVIDMGTAAGTCNGSAGTPASSYFASAEPVTPGVTGASYFATDARGTIFSSPRPIANPIVESATVMPIR